MTVEQTQVSDTTTTSAVDDTTATATTTTQASDTATVNATDDSAAKSYTQADLESAKRGLIKQQAALQKERDAALAKLAKHEEANLSELEKAQKAREAAEELANQKDAMIAEMKLEANRNKAIQVLTDLKVEHARVLAAAIPDEALGDPAKVEQWAKDQNLIKAPGGNLPGGKQGTAGNTQTKRPTGNLYRTIYER